MNSAHTPHPLSRRWILILSSRISPGLFNDVFSVPNQNCLWIYFKLACCLPRPSQITFILIIHISTSDVYELYTVVKFVRSANWYRYFSLHSGIWTHSLIGCKIFTHTFAEIHSQVKNISQVVSWLSFVFYHGHQWSFQTLLRYSSINNHITWALELS
jgi:hypothetical protein